MASTQYAFTRGLDYASIVATSEHVAWTVSEIFGDRSFDASRPIVPTSWVGTIGLDFLDEREQRTLNHCRAFSYVHLLGNYEEFIPLHLNGLVRQDWRGDRSHFRALLRFGDEELKHQELFREAELVLERSCDHPFVRYFDDDKVRVTDFTRDSLEHSPLARFLLLLAFEWGTQRHYVESIRDRAADRGDGLYADVLKAHWVEEAQHVKSDTVEIARLATGMSDEEIASAFDELGSLGRLIDASLVGQAAAEVETLQCVSGRRLPDAQVTQLRETLHRSLGAIIVGISLTHPNFTRIARELSPDGAARLLDS
jgi:hypothetical protein